MLGYVRQNKTRLKTCCGLFNQDIHAAPTLTIVAQSPPHILQVVADDPFKYFDNLRGSIMVNIELMKESVNQNKTQDKKKKNTNAIPRALPSTVRRCVLSVAFFPLQGALYTDVGHRMDLYMS